MLVAKTLVVVAMGGADSLGATLVVTVAADADVVEAVPEGEGETPRAAAAFLRFPAIVLFWLSGSSFWFIVGCN